MHRVLHVSLLLLVAGCSQSPAPGSSGPQLAISVAPLELPGLDDACYDLRVDNADGLVWARGNPAVTRLGADQTAPPGTLPGVAGDDRAVCASAFGNASGGDITYVGPCDADSDADPRDGVQNAVTLWVDGLYRNGADVGDWQDPCPSGCRIVANCQANSDTLVPFDLTVMRDAGQGFFDVSVNFGDIFCSAKFDTCYDDGTDAGDDPDPIRLVFGADGERDHTGVMGFACTAGAGTSTELLFGAPVINCDNGDVFVLDPTVLGNAHVDSTTNPDHRIHYGVYRGREALACVGSEVGSCGKSYWNLAVSLDDLVALNTACSFVHIATASDGTGFTAGLPTTPGLAYPYVTWTATLTSARPLPDTTGVAGCQQAAVNDGSGIVATSYRGDLGGLATAPVLCDVYDGTTVTATGGDQEECGAPAPPPTCDPIELDDNNACTIDTCVAGVPNHSPVDCDDFDDCTEDTCNPVNGICDNIAITTPPCGGDEPPAAAALTTGDPLVWAAFRAGPGATPLSFSGNVADPLDIDMVAGLPLTPQSGSPTTTELSVSPTEVLEPSNDTTTNFSADLVVTATLPSGTPACEFLTPYETLTCTLDANGLGGALLARNDILPGASLTAEVFTLESPDERLMTNTLSTERFAYRQMSNTNQVPNDGVSNVMQAGGKVFFSARVNANEFAELHVYDPVADTIQQVIDTSPTGADSAFAWIVTPNYLYFRATGADFSSRLYAYRLADGVISTLASPTGFGFAAKGLAYGDELIFTLGNSLYRYSPATNTATNLTPGVNIQVSMNDGATFVIAHDVVYFRANHTDGNLYLWSYDLTTATLTRKTDARRPGGLVARGGNVYVAFTPTGGFNDRFFWRNNGSGWTQISTGLVGNCRDPGAFEVGSDVFVVASTVAGATSDCGDSRLRRIDTTTGNVVNPTGDTINQVTSERPYVVQGKWLVFVQYLPVGYLGVVNLDTNVTSQLGFPSWTQGGPVAYNGDHYYLEGTSSDRTTLRRIVFGASSLTTVSIAAGAPLPPTEGSIAYYPSTQNLYRYDYATLPAAGSVVGYIGTTGSDEVRSLAVFQDELYINARYDGNSSNFRLYHTQRYTGDLHTVDAT